MNNFNKIFATVQKQCEKQGSVIGSDQFQKMAAETGISIERLHFYLDCLEQTGLIRYSGGKRSIELTEKGANTQNVFQ